MKINYIFDNIVESKNYKELTNDDLKAKLNELEHYLDNDAKLYKSIAKKKLNDVISDVVRISLVDSDISDNTLTIKLTENLDTFVFSIVLEDNEIKGMKFPNSDNCDMWTHEVIANIPTLAKIFTNFGEIKKNIIIYLAYAKSYVEYTKLREYVYSKYIESLDVTNYSVGSVYRKNNMSITITKITDKTISFSQTIDGVTTRRRLKYKAFNKFFVDNLA